MVTLLAVYYWVKVGDMRRARIWAGLVTFEGLFWIFSTLLVWLFLLK